MRGIGFHPCESEACLYRRGNGSNINLIAVYVDDFLIARSDLNELNIIKSKISERVLVVDKGPAKHFLTEMESLDKLQFIKMDILESFYQMEECRPISTPLEPIYQVICDNDNSDLYAILHSVSKLKLGR